MLVQWIKRVAAYDGGMKQTFSNIQVNNIAQSEWEQNTIILILENHLPMKEELYSLIAVLHSEAMSFVFYVCSDGPSWRRRRVVHDTETPF